MRYPLLTMNMVHITTVHLILATTLMSMEVRILFSTWFSETGMAAFF